MVWFYLQIHHLSDLTSQKYIWNQQNKHFLYKELHFILVQWKCNSYIYLRQHIFQVMASHPGVVIMPRPTYLYDGWINRRPDVTHSTEPFGCWFVYWNMKKISWHLYHCSTLRWHMPLKLFLVEYKDTSVLHGCHWLGNIRRQGIHSLGIDLVTQNILASAKRWNDNNKEFQNNWNIAPHLCQNEWQWFTRWLLESRSMRTSCYFVAVINLKLHGIQFNILIFK